VRVLFVKQDHASPGGLVEDAFASLGYDISEFTVVPRERYTSPNVTVTFPDPQAYDAIVLFGAVWAIYDEAAIGNWIGDEITFTRRAMAGGVPVFGICFGGQLLAAAAGGQVSRAPAPEIGWHAVESDAPSLIDPGPWFQWHFDKFAVPDGVPVLARTALASQAFVVGRSLGLQFHPELTPSVLECWLDSGGDAELAAQGVDADALMARTRSLAAEAAPRTHELVRRFVRDVATTPIDGTAGATVLTPRACLSRRLR
jgi:GMP synthase-like glutamine amidotransferase